MKNLEKFNELTKIGDKYLSYFLLIFLFLHFTIIIPYRNPQPENNGLTMAGKLIDYQVKEITHLINDLEEGPNGKQAPSKTAGEQRKDEDRILELREKQIGLLQRQADIIDKKREDRSFSIPVIGITIKESIVLSIYPCFILSGLCMALSYRRRFMVRYENLSLAERKGIRFPVWAVPIPTSVHNGSFSYWLIINTFGLTCHFLVIGAAADFLIYCLAERSAILTSEIIALNITVGIVSLFFYLITFLEPIYQKWKGASPKERLAEESL